MPTERVAGASINCIVAKIYNLWYGCDRLPVDWQEYGPIANKSKYDCPPEGSPTRIFDDRGLPVGR
jgi:hypothetical protein